MAKRDFLLRYSYIINKLRVSKYATYEEIKEYFEINKEVFDCEISSKRTFQRDIIDIRSIFKIDIQCRRKDGRYHIEEYTMPNSGQEYMLEVFDMLNTLNIVGQHSDYIHFEKRKAKGTEFIVQLVQAIKNKHVVKFNHHSYQENYPTNRTVEPYGVKEARGRWYLIGRDLEDNEVKTFGLDRLYNIEETRISINNYENYDVDEDFKYCFGVSKPNDPPVEIILAFDEIQGKYIKSYPLHETQEIIKDTNKEFIIKLNIKITYDLIMEILSYSNSVTIVSPEPLKETINNILTKACKRNKKKKNLQI